jgi:hypothetical protein
VSRAPGFDALVTVLDRHGGPGDVMRRPFGLGDAGTVRALLAATGFTAPHVTTQVIAARFPSVREFFERQAAGSPLAGPLAALPDTTRAAMIRDLAAALGDRVDDDGLLLPIESHVVTATA